MVAKSQQNSLKKRIFISLSCAGLRIFLNRLCKKNRQKMDVVIQVSYQLAYA